MQLHFLSHLKYAVIFLFLFLFQSIMRKTDGAVTEVAIDFVTYGTKASGDRSGAYLFLPDGPAEVCTCFWSVIVFRDR